MCICIYGGRPFVMCPDKGHPKSPTQEKVIEKMASVGIRTKRLAP